MEPGRRGLIAWLGIGLVAVAVGCAARPVVYTNGRSGGTGNAQLERDIDECLTLARRHAGEGRAAARDAARNTAGGAVIGGATGAVGGAIFGNPGRGAAAGAAMGATSGLLRTVFRSRSGDDPVLRRYTERCLAERGHDVLVWR
jgi:hypothetical protein